MAYPTAVKNRARRMRARGYSIKEVAVCCAVSPSTVLAWVRDVELGLAAMRRIERRRELGRIHSAQYFARRAVAEDKVAKAAAKALVDSMKKRAHLLLLVALWWCEGSKDLSKGIEFTNADPAAVKLFLKAMRRIFVISESRLRVQLQLHEYHDVSAEVAYWSQVTRIPPQQFNKPYIKPHTGKRKREGYPGCACVRYSDARLARQLKAVWDIISISEPGV